MASSQVVLITGANTGIGFETVKALLRSDKPYHILLGGRDMQKAQAAAEAVKAEIPSDKSSVEPIQVDVGDDASIQKAFEKVSSMYDRVDCLLNNAGATFDRFVHDGSMTLRQAWNKTWDVNVTGAHIMTETFLPLLLKSKEPRLVFVTSGLSSLEFSANPTQKYYVVPPRGLPKPPANATAYRSSKAGLNMMMIEWSKILKNDGVKVWSVAPGLLATNLAGNPEVMKKMGAGDPALGGTALRVVVEGKRDADSGKVIREYDTPVQPW